MTDSVMKKNPCFCGRFSPQCRSARCRRCVSQERDPRAGRQDLRGGAARPPFQVRWCFLFPQCGTLKNFLRERPSRTRPPPPGRHRSLSRGVCVVKGGVGGGCSGMYPEGLWEGRLTGQARGGGLVGLWGGVWGGGDGSSKQKGQPLAAFIRKKI